MLKASNPKVSRNPDKALHRPTGQIVTGQPIEYENDFQFLLSHAMRTLDRVSGPRAP
jgi:hypothetical protein